MFHFPVVMLLFTLYFSRKKQHLNQLQVSIYLYANLVKVFWRHSTCTCTVILQILVYLAIYTLISEGYGNCHK